ncbi:MAG TPA: single-stranded DNA-binding protein [Geminicoccaceae bacterium]|nr:single-stranded DNA-binding protein [Geminicoccaceae bacterium]
MYQRFIAVGRLGRDPEVTTAGNGSRYATLSLATSEFVKGEERTEWHRVVVWDEKLVEVLERRAAKGTLVAIEGQVRTRKWQQKDGREGTTTEVVLDRFNSRLRVLDRGVAANGNGEQPEERGAERRKTERASAPRGRAPAMAEASVESAAAERFEFEDELPF